MRRSAAVACGALGALAIAAGGTGIGALAGCAQAQRHPAITAGIVGGVVGFGGCEIDATDVLTCGIIGGSTAVFLGGIAALVTLLADTTDHTLELGDDAPTPPGVVRARRRDAPPAPLDLGFDAGVEAPLPPPAVASDAATVDAAP